MISLDEIQQVAGEANADIAVIEKDYVLSWVLKGIFESSVADSLVFKGGTALRKVYFKDYRFSEDLDFTISKPVEPADFQSSLADVCRDVRSQSGLEMNLIGLRQTRSETGQEAFEGKIEYIGPRQHRGSPSRIKLDLTAHEQIILPPVTFPLIHGYSDQCQAKISTYQLEEILAEKMRTIIQRSYPRDLYDSWYILKFHQDRIDFSKLISTYRKKCEFKNIRPVDWKAFFQTPAILNKEAAFSNSLGRQLKDLPGFAELTNELTKLLTDLGSKTKS